MQHCMLCNKTGRIFNIFEDWNGKHTIKDDLLEIFGLKVEPYLKEDDVICNLCMNIMENFAKLKRRLLPIIIDRSSRAYDTTPIKFGKLWDLFATFPVEDEPDTLMSCPSPSPSLLKYSHSKPYHDGLETKIAAREGARVASQRLSLSRASSQYYSDTSLNREVSEITERKQKKRKGKKNLWTRRKRKSKLSTSGTSSFRNSSLSSYRITPVDSSDSDCSYQSFYLPHSRPTTTTSVRSPSSVKYDEGRLINKRTRSVSRAQEEEAQKVAEQERDAMIFYCNFDSCIDNVYTDLDLYTFHKQSKHMCMAQYTCDMGCTKQYITKDDLELHKKVKHDSELLLCSMCGIEVLGPRALQKHVDEHLAYSVACIYCDKYFLDKKHRDDHVKEYHKGKKRRIKQNHAGIIDRVDKSDSDDDYSESEASSPIPYEKKPFCIRVVTPSELHGYEQSRVGDKSPTVISLFGQLLQTTPVSRSSSTNMDRISNGACSVHSVSTDIVDKSTDCVNNGASNLDEIDTIESPIETNSAENVIQSDVASDSNASSAENESTDYISVDSLEKSDKLFTQCPKIVLTDYLKVPPATLTV